MRPPECEGVYVAVCPQCGGFVGGACILKNPTPTQRKNLGRDLSQAVRDGYRIERVPEPATLMGHHPGCAHGRGGARSDVQGRLP